MHDRILRVFPPLMNESFFRAAMIFHKQISVLIAVMIDPVQSERNIGPDAFNEVQITGLVVVGGCKHDKQRGGIYTPIIPTKWNFAEPCNFASTHFMKNISGFRLRSRVCDCGLTCRKKTEDSSRDCGIDP